MARVKSRSAFLPYHRRELGKYGDIRMVFDPMSPFKFKVVHMWVNLQFGQNLMPAGATGNTKGLKEP